MDFIDFAMESFCSNPDKYFTEAERLLNDYYSGNHQLFAAKLREKLERGKREHGAVPTYTKEQLQKEMADELIDIIGYQLIDDWLNK